MRYNLPDGVSRSMMISQSVGFMLRDPFTRQTQAVGIDWVPATYLQAVMTTCGRSEQQLLQHQSCLPVQWQRLNLCLSQRCIDLLLGWRGTGRALSLPGLLRSSLHASLILPLQLCPPTLIVRARQHRPWPVVRSFSQSLDPAQLTPAPAQHLHHIKAGVPSLVLAAVV